MSEIEDKLDEINSGLSSDISSLNTMLSTINTDLSTVKTNVATNNAASSTGALSQKLSWIGNSLIGATNATGGSTTAGTVMAKLNALLNIVAGVYSEKTASQSGKTTETSFLALYNVILYSAEVRCKGYAGDYDSVVKLYIDDESVISDSTSSSTYSYAGTTGSVTIGNCTYQLPMYVSSLTVSGYGDSSNTSRNYQAATIKYIQL